MMHHDAKLTIHSRMEEVLAALPGAKRALFAKYHLGGCQSCAFDPSITLAELAARNEIVAEEMLSHLLGAAENDAKLLIAPAELKQQLETGVGPRLVDIRTREEFEAVAIKGSEFFDQNLQQSLFARAAEVGPVVLIDHLGDRGLDMAAWFAGHGCRETRALVGGIDAWSREVDPSVPRYRIELDSPPADAPPSPSHSPAS